MLINNAVEAAGYLLMKKYKEKDGDKKVGGANSTSSNSQNGGKSNYNINKNDHAILENLSDIKQLDMFLGKYDNIFYENLGSVYGNKYGNTIQSGGDSSKKNRGVATTEDKTRCFTILDPNANKKEKCSGNGILIANKCQCYDKYYGKNVKENVIMLVVLQLMKKIY